MRQLAGLLAQTATAGQAIGARPALSTDGVDITQNGWRSGSLGSPMAAVFIDGSVAAQLTSPAGGAEGVELWGYQPAINAWYLIAILHDGGPINIAGANQGYAQVLNDLGDFTRLAVAATVSAGAATAKFAAMESWTF